MKILDICSKKTYKKDGQEKSICLKCGSLRITDEGKQFIELNHLPGVSFYCFEQKAKDVNPKSSDQIAWSE